MTARKSRVPEPAGTGLHLPLPSVRLLGRLLAPMRRWHRPTFAGLENIDPQKPGLLVGNHTLYGLLDVPHLGYEVLRTRGVHLVGLADRAHFKVPIWRSLLESMGAVEGSRENCDALMRAGQHVLVFPGGAREVFKRKGEAYQLIWKDRTGFARMAIQHGYPIIPFAAVGAEEAYKILVDGDEIMRSPVGRLLRATGIAEKFLRNGESLMPLVRGLGPTWIPRRERFYFSVGKPISTRRLRGHEDDDAVLLALRDRVKAQVETHIKHLLRQRAKDAQERR